MTRPPPEPPPAAEEGTADSDPDVKNKTVPWTNAVGPPLNQPGDIKDIQTPSTRPPPEPPPAAKDGTAESDQVIKTEIVPRTHTAGPLLKTPTLPRTPARSGYTQTRLE